MTNFEEQRLFSIEITEKHRTIMKKRSELFRKKLELNNKMSELNKQEAELNRQEAELKDLEKKFTTKIKKKIDPEKLTTVNNGLYGSKESIGCDNIHFDKLTDISSNSDKDSVDNIITPFNLLDYDFFSNKDL